MSYNYRKGDIVGTLGYHPISVAIQWATRSKNEPESFSNHNEIIVNDCDLLRDVETVAAMGSGVERHKLCEVYAGKRDQVEIWRALNFSDEDRELIADAAIKHIGHKYPYHRILLQLIDEKIFGGKFVVRRLAFSENFFVCTPLVVHAIWAADYRFGFKSPAQANPDNLRDYLQNNPDKYINIRPLARID